MQLTQVVLIATSHSANEFCTTLADALRRRGKVQPHISQYFNRTRDMTRADCAQKKFTFVSIAGTTEEIRLGLETLFSAARHCPVGILMDLAGYRACTECRVFPAHKVRLIVTIGDGDFVHVWNRTLRCSGSKVVQSSIPVSHSLETVSEKFEQVAIAPLWGL